MKCKCDNGVVRIGADYSRPCHYCGGTGELPEINAELIELALIARGTLRKSAPPVKSRNNVFGKRCYYVWRLAQFHGGVDMRMPMGAEIECHGASVSELDTLDSVANFLAKKYLGSNMRAALRYLDLI